MCIAMPMRVIEFLPGGRGVAERSGNRVTVDLRLLSEVGLGDYVLIHAGCAIERVDSEAATEMLNLLEEISSYEQ